MFIMKKNYLTLIAEHQLIIICSRMNLSEDEKQQIADIIKTPTLDWAEVLYQALSHRILNMIYFHLKSMKLLGFVEEEILKLMHYHSQVYLIRNNMYKEELYSISAALIREGIKAPVLKGSYLACYAYPTIETRTFNDIDLLVKISDGQKILEILESSGYIQGDYDRNTFEITPASRKQKIMHQMSTHEFLECLKPSNNPFVPLLQLDLNHDILWKGNCAYLVDSSELIDRAIIIGDDGQKTCRLSHEDFLLQLCCHLYKEAVMINWIHDLRDLKLYKFADFAVYLDKFGENVRWDIFVKQVQDYSLQKIAYFALYYADYIYDVIPQHVLASLEQEDKAYLNQYAIETGTPQTWSMDFFTRLFNSKHKLEIDQELMKTKDAFWNQRMI